ncbi:MAG: hypothetical protein EPO30_07370 [Lysobacteraceae bacterium]|nr:MAG: hypothetical protein EPO30_07370 [Xanthomonadaceae bacterium]
MQTMGLIFISVMCFFWGGIAMEHWGMPWGVIGGLAIFAVPVFGWWLKFRFARRESQRHKSIYFAPRPRKVFGKAAGLTFLLLVGAMIVGRMNMVSHFAPDWVSYPALLMFSPFTSWGLIIVPLLVGKAYQLVVDSAPLKINPERVEFYRKRQEWEEEYARSQEQA